MQKYQFDRIFQQMGKEFGIIEKGDENAHNMVFFIMEGNVLKIHRNNPSANSRRMIEAIALVLFDVKGYLDGTKYDTDNFRNEENSELEKALLMAFDPFTNNEVKEMLGDDLNTIGMHKYFTEPVRCLLRIRESIDIWVKKLGVDGYFSMLEDFIGKHVENDSKMNYIVLKKIDNNFKL